MRTYSPIALFVYNRLDNTQKTIEQLKKNTLASQSELYIFSDGGKDEKSWKQVRELRDYLHTVNGFKCVHIIEREKNIYIERNITEGIQEVFQEHDTIIVLEDDICTSPVFLDYMNSALEKYQDEEKVMHIAGFTNLDLQGKGDTYFTPHMSGWGWATWKHKWQYFQSYSSKEEALKGLTPEDLKAIEYDGNFKCLKSLNYNPIPWDICWELIIYKRKGLCLHPTHTLVKNIGIANGTHFSSQRIFGWYDYDREVRTQPITFADIPIRSDEAVEEAYKKALKDHGMRYNWFGKIVRFFYLLVFPKKEG